MANQAKGRPVSAIGKILREIRKERGMSIAHVSDISAVPSNTIRMFEKSQHKQLDSIEALCEALGYEIDILLKDQ